MSSFDLTEETIIKLKIYKITIINNDFHFLWKNKILIYIATFYIETFIENFDQNNILFD